MAQRAIESHWESGLEESLRTGGTLALANQPIDLEAEQNHCPACGAAFSTAEGRCGECGLRFA